MLVNNSSQPVKWYFIKCASVRSRSSDFGESFLPLVYDMYTQEHVVLMNVFLYFSTRKAFKNVDYFQKCFRAPKYISNVHVFRDIQMSRDYDETIILFSELDVCIHMANICI